MSARAFRPAARLAPALAFALAACSTDEGTVGLNASSALELGGLAPSSFCASLAPGAEVDDVYVASGTSCTLDGTRVRGNVKVGRGATLLAIGADVEGDVQAEDAAAVSLTADTRVDGNVQVKRRAAVLVEDSWIGGDLQVEERNASLVTANTRVGGNVQVTKAASAAITGLWIEGDLQLTENRGALSVTDTDVLSNLQVFKNLAGVQLEGNRIAQALQCKENSPAPLGSGNVAGEKEEQCRAL